MSEWQLIETAPRDGTEILIFGPGQMSVARWANTHLRGGWAVYTDHGWYGFESYATHWMPLPEPPK